MIKRRNCSTVRNTIIHILLKFVYTLHLKTTLILAVIRSMSKAMKTISVGTRPGNAALGHSRGSLGPHWKSGSGIGSGYGVS